MHFAHLTVDPAQGSFQAHLAHSWVVELEVPLYFSKSVPELVICVILKDAFFIRFVRTTRWFSTADAF